MTPHHRFAGIISLKFVTTTKVFSILRWWLEDARPSSGSSGSSWNCY